MANDPLKLTPEQIKPAFPGAKLAAIQKYWPDVREALRRARLTSPEIVAYALATIAAETAGFVPLYERVSQYNTRIAAFDRYENRADLGNTKIGDAKRFRGRGFVQLTGRINYETYGERLGIPLAANPEWANAPDVAAQILAEFIADKEAAILIALRDGNLAGARRLVNGGTHGLDRFDQAYRTMIKTLNDRMGFELEIKNSYATRERDAR